MDRRVFGRLIGALAVVPWLPGLPRPRDLVVPRVVLPTPTPIRFTRMWVTTPDPLLNCSTLELDRQFVERAGRLVAAEIDRALLAEGNRIMAESKLRVPALPMGHPNCRCVVCSVGR